MAKKKAKKIKSTVPPVVTVVPRTSTGGWVKFFPFIITGVFFLLSLFGILRHEMWRDEYQAWMVAADAHSIPQLFQNLKYEGNPVLWHAFLFILSALSHDPFIMQVFHILISGSFIFLINRYAPFSILEKVLLTFGYYTFFEYNIISRSYGLGFLLLVFICVLYRERQKSWLWIAALLFLLANCTIFGVILAVSIAGVMLLEQTGIAGRKADFKLPVSQAIIFAFIAFTGALLGYLQIRPEPDNSFTTFYVTHYDPVRFKWAWSRFLEAYFPIPDFANFHFWNTSLFTSPKGPFRIGITPFLFLAGILSFLRHRMVLVLYVIGSSILIVFFYYTGFYWSRYAGHLFLLFVACQWLVYVDRERSYSNSFLQKLSIYGAKLRTPYFLVILGASVIGGVGSYILDLKEPFSTSAQAARYLRDNDLAQYEIIGVRDYAISPLASQLGKKIYYPERNEPGSFIIYDRLRVPIGGINDVIPVFQRMHRQGMKRMILVKDAEISMVFNDTGEKVPWTDAMLTDSLNLKLLTTIRPGIVEDETYFIYSIDEKLIQ